MPDLKELKNLLEKHGYKLESPVFSERNLIALISGGKLEDMSVVMRATDDVCNLGIVIGLFEAVAERNRYSLLMSLLELNFNHPLAHTSFVRVRVPDSSEQKTQIGEAEHRGIILAETSFFWPGMTQERFDARAKALNAIAFAASQHLATRDALSNTNPFYHRLKGASSPVSRQDFSPSTK